MIHAGEEYLHIEVDSMNGKPSVTLAVKYWQPLHDRILVKRMASDGRIGSIIIPDCAREKSKFARVVAVGPGAWRDGFFEKTAVKPGDVVLVPGAGNKFPDWEEHDTIVIQEGDVGAIVG